LQKIVSNPEWLGITCHVDDLNTLKSHGLLFDRLLIHRLYERYLLGDEQRQRSLGVDPDQREAEFEYLNSSGLIISGPPHPGGEVCNPAGNRGMETENYFRSYSYSQDRWFAACISLAFKSASDSSRMLLSLRTWIHKARRTAASPKEIAAELDSLIGEYKSYLRMHQIKTGEIVFETLVTAVADVVENLAKFRYGQLARMPFRMREKRMALLEAELNAPGRDISYIVKANELFPIDRQ
jgi:hypothetical protein